MKILLLVIGKTDEDYLVTGIKKYVGRIGHYVSFEMKEIPDPRNRKTLSEDQQKKAESFLILQQLQPGDQVILLDENGKQIHVSFIDRIRDEEKFDSLDELKAQLEQDRDNVYKLLENTKL